MKKNNKILFFCFLLLGYTSEDSLGKTPTPAEIQRMSPEEYAAYLRKKDEKSRKACTKINTTFQTRINNIIRQEEEPLKAQIQGVLDKHHSNISVDRVLKALKAKYHAPLDLIHNDIENIDKISKQVDCGPSKLAPLVSQNFEGRYKKVYEEMGTYCEELILRGFFKCPDNLTKENIDAIIDLQKNKTMTAVLIEVKNPHFNAFVSFNIDREKLGHGFKYWFNSPQNTLVWQKIETIGNRTYCPYAWKGKIDKHKETSIYYVN